MSLSPELRRDLEARLGPVRVAGAVGGGCIDRAYRVECGARSLLVKHRTGAPPGYFAAEAAGLQALREATGGRLTIPAVVAQGDGDPAWIALEWLEPTAATPAAQESLGHGLAMLHARQAAGWGWEGDNHIGSLPQANGRAGSWAAFWIERRLEPMLRLATDAGGRPGRREEWERLFASIPDRLAPVRRPSLLHGDLWSGNVLFTTTGPALIDPAVYRGHAEVDLAMAELFGGFDARCFAAYHEHHPADPDYARARRGIYQLYYLLVHVKLFGGAYVAKTARVLQQCLAS